MCTVCQVSSALTRALDISLVITDYSPQLNQAWLQSHKQIMTDYVFLTGCSEAYRLKCMILLYYFFSKIRDKQYLSKLFELIDPFLMKVEPWITGLKGMRLH